MQEGGEGLGTKYQKYSGAPLLWGSGEVSCIERCALFSGNFILRKHIWDISKVLIEIYSIQWNMQSSSTH